MQPDQVKQKIQLAFRQAIANASTQWSRDDSVGHLFRDVRLYGRDAAADFISTNIDAIVSAAVTRAECKDTALTIMLHGSGNAALDGIVETLRTLTGLLVERKGSTVVLTWANAAPQLV